MSVSRAHLLCAPRGRSHGRDWGEVDGEPTLQAEAGDNRRGARGTPVLLSAFVPAAVLCHLPASWRQRAVPVQALVHVPPV